MLQVYQLSPPPETEHLLSGHPHQEVEVDVKVRPPGRPDPAPLLGGEVRAGDPMEDPCHRPPAPCVLRVLGDKRPDGTSHLLRSDDQSYYSKEKFH